MFSTSAVVDGAELIVPPTPIPVGPGGFADGTGMTGAFVDVDSDGAGDEASGTLTLSGPGFNVPDVAWTIGRPAVVGMCDRRRVGLPSARAHPRHGRGADVRLGHDGRRHRAVRDRPRRAAPDGPGHAVTGGQTYWALQTTAFPTGFVGPVTYGEVPTDARDDGMIHGAPDGGAPLEAGKCYQVSVVSNRFSTGSLCSGS